MRYDMEFSVKNVIPRRKSVRTFSEEPLRAVDRKRLESFLGSVENPFGVPVRFHLLDAWEYNLSSPVVRGAELYVAAKAPRVPRAEEAFGYAFEQFVLYAAHLGIGTVWLAGTLDRSAFENALELTESELMPAVSPVGYPASRRSVRENLMRRSVRADTRRPFSELFFRGGFSEPLVAQYAGEFREPLEMLRLAPSAVNRQPWRVVVGEGVVHFCLRRSRGRFPASAGDLPRVDMGIALAHFLLTARENGLEGRLTEERPELELPDHTEYVISYRLS